MADIYVIGSVLRGESNQEKFGERIQINISQIIQREVGAIDSSELILGLNVEHCEHILVLALFGIVSFD